MIIFVAGGMTYSEIRSAYEVGAKLQRDVYIGALILSLCCVLLWS